MYFLYGYLKKAGNRFVLTDHSGVCAYLYDMADEKKLILVNSTTENFAETTFSVSSMTVNEIYYIDKKTGRKRKAEFRIDGDKIVVRLSFEYLSTHTFIIK